MPFLFQYSLKIRIAEAQFILYRLYLPVDNLISLMPRPEYLFVVNPISGGNDKSTFYQFIEEEFENDEAAYELYITSGTDDEYKLKKLYKKLKPDVVVAVGGDGTLLLVAKITRNTSSKIGLMPFGSANGMSRELGIPKISERTLSLIPSDRFMQCWKIIQQGNTKDVDLLQINKNHYSLHLSDIGLNAKIVKRFEKEKIRGYFGYARLFFKEFKQKTKISYQLTANGKRYRGRAYMIVIANATMYGTGAVINPVGKYNDGNFEICIIKEIKLIGLLRSLFRIFRKNLQYRKDLVKIISCKNATIELKQPETLQVDGEVVGEIKKADIKIIPGALRIIV